MQVHTAAIQSLQQQSGKAHYCHQEQRAHDHGSTGSTNNLRTLATGYRWVVWIADVRCSIVTHYIWKVFPHCQELGFLKGKDGDESQSKCFVHV